MAKSSKKARAKTAKKKTSVKKTTKKKSAVKKKIAKKAPKKAVAKKKAKKVMKKKAKTQTKKASVKKKSTAKKKTSKKTISNKPAQKKLAVKKDDIKVSTKNGPVKVETIRPTKESKEESSPKTPISQINMFQMPNQRPIAHKRVKPEGEDGKTKYSAEELKEFEALILGKLEKAKEEYKILKDTLNRNNDEGTDSTSGGNTKVLEDGAETAEKENLSQLAARQQKYITNLENALIRIKNGTYGICSVTGKLISKERLIAVPHTTQSIEAKIMKQD